MDLWRKSSVSLRPQGPHGLQHSWLPCPSQLLEFAQIHVHWHPLSSLSSPTLNLPQHQGLFQWVSSLHQMAEILELQLQHQSFQWIFRVSFKIDWYDLLAVQGTLKSFLQHHSLKASVLRHSAFFMAQLSHPYMTTGKTIALTVWTFVSKLMSLLFNTLSLS